MQIHELRGIPKKIAKKRVGRGGKRGTFSGRGTKGQHARAGRKIRPAERDLLLKFPKRKGVKHPRLTKGAVVLNLRDLEKKVSGNELTLPILLAQKIIKTLRAPVKILGSGTVTKKWTVSGVELSKSAIEKIEKAGGTIIKG